MSEIIAGLTEFFADIDWAAMSEYIVQCLKTLPAAPLYILMWVVAGISGIIDSVTGINTNEIAHNIIVVIGSIAEHLIIS